MELYLNGSGRRVLLQNDIDINLYYDRIASTFSVSVLFDPYNPQHKEWFRPASFQDVVIKHGGVTVLTGTLISIRFTSSGNPPKTYAHLTGYSKTGILEKCTVLNTDVATVDVKDDKGNVVSQTISPIPSQFVGENLGDIAKNICAVFPINVIIDDSVKEEVAATYPNSTKNRQPDQTIKDFLTGMCQNKHVILSHDRFGNLLLTRAQTNKIQTTSSTFVKSRPVDGDSVAFAESTGSKNTDRPVLCHFKSSASGDWVKMNLTFDGENMHSVIQVVGQQNGGNAPDSICINPYGGASKRYRVEVQKDDTDDNTTPKTARMIAGDELKANTLTIELKGWTLGGNLIVPNQLISVQNPEVYCYDPVTWFVQEVRLYGNEKEELATIVCTLPDAFNDDDIKFIF